MSGANVSGHHDEDLHLAIADTCGQGRRRLGRPAVRSGTPTELGDGGLDPIVAVTVPSASDLVAAKSLLFRGKAEGWWDLDEGYADARWDAVEQ